MFKSKLGRIALEELNESPATTEETGEDKPKEEGAVDATTVDAGTTDVTATGDAGATDTTVADAVVADGDAGAVATDDAAATGDAVVDAAATGDDAAAAAAGAVDGVDTGAAADADAAAAAATAAAAGADAGAVGDLGAIGDAGAAGDTGLDGATGPDDTGLAADATATGADGEVTDAAAAVAQADGADAATAEAAATQVEATGDPAAVIDDAGDFSDPEAEVVEEEMGAVDKLEEKAGDVDEDVEKLNIATEALEGCVAILDAAAQRGGLDMYGACLLRNNTRTVTNLLKLKPLLLPALEDMESPSAKIDGANTAKDQIVAFIKRMIEAIKTAFIRVGEWIVETYKRLTNAFVAIERRAERLAERLKSSTMKEGNIDSKAIAAKMTMMGKAVQGKDVVSALANTAKFASDINDPKSYKGYLEVLDLCEQLVKEPEKSEELNGQIATKLKAWGADLGRVARTAGMTSEESNGLITYVLPLLNNQVVGVTLPLDSQSIRAMASQVRSAESMSAGGAATTITALNQADALKICEVVANLAKQIRESGEANRGGVKELVDEINKRKDTITAMSNVAMASVLKEMGSDSEKLRKVMIFVNTVLMTAPKLPVHAINRALPRNLSAALDYVGASLGGAVEAAA